MRGARGCERRTTRLEAAWTNIRNQAAQVPYAEHPAITDPELPSYVRDWMSHREQRTITGRTRTSARSYERIRIPALHIAGWFDTYLEGSIAGYRRVAQTCGE